MRLRLISLSVLPAVVILAGTIGWNELVATESGAEMALYETPQQSSAGPSARGHVDLVPVEGSNQGLQRYSFTARRHSDGTVRGQFQVFDNVGTALEVRAHGEVTCLAVLPDGTARMGGVITHREPALAPSQPAGVLWVVKDNGEGRNAVDAGTLMLFNFPAELTARVCHAFTFPPLASTRGNVQVSAY